MTAPITPDERAAMRALVDALAHDCDASDQDLKKWVLLPVKYVRAVLEYVPRLLDALDTAEAEVGLQRERLRSRERAAGHLRAEVTRLHAEVARLRAETLRAATSPAWDEDAVIEAMARAANPRRFRDNYAPFRGFGETRSDDELRECAREVERHKMRNVLAVVREHLPTRPDRETARYAGGRAYVEGGGPWDVADAVLALLPGRSEATVKAEALRDAAATFAARLPDGAGNGRAYNSHQVADMLTARAERIAAHADDATCASCTHEYVADMERRVEEAEAKAERQRDRLRAREEQVRRLRAEVTRLHALVADLRTEATVSPAWDEGAVTEAACQAVTEVYERHGDRFQPDEEEMVTAVLAVVREHLPVRPDREAVALTLCKEQDSIEHMEQTDDAPCSRCLAWADAVLALWPGESRAQVQAEALREFADTRGVNVGDDDDEWWRGYRQAQRECLHDASARADRLTGEGGQQ